MESVWLNRGQIPILYSQRIGTVKPVFASIRHNKRLTRFNHRGREKVNTQWNLYCMEHNIEKLAKSGYASVGGETGPAEPRQALWRKFAAHLARYDENFNLKPQFF